MIMSTILWHAMWQSFVFLLFYFTAIGVNTQNFKQIVNSHCKVNVQKKFQISVISRPKFTGLFPECEKIAVNYVFV